MGLFLNFGAGQNQLPEPWQNLNAAHDIRKRLKFEDGSASAILAEHVIEHAPFLQGFGFLGECLRVLEPGGVLRLAFPDVGRLLTPSCYDELRSFSYEGNAYARALFGAPGALGAAAAQLLLTGWQHQAAWTRDSACGALLAVGFSEVRERMYEEGELPNVDGHHKAVGDEIARIETTIVEAKK